MLRTDSLDGFILEKDKVSIEFGVDTDPRVRPLLDPILYRY